MTPTMPGKISKNNKNCGNGEKSNKVKSKLACILEASESTRLRIGESLPTHLEDHIAGKRENSLQHYNLVHKSSRRLYCRKRREFSAALQFGAQIYSYASSHENSRSKGSSGQGMGKIGDKFGVEPDESQK